MHFRTSNVLVDENFTAKVSDYGLSKFLTEGDHAGSTSTVDSFLDPEYVISLGSTKNVHIDMHNNSTSLRFDCFHPF
jgi:hypothetical protein